ncbi:hypothetical protein TSAR_012730 [Trichomalopsis sarcophagae]|uniref:Uncharacterized protein n=1 Tax=Trichomalopsis sarcophagae TaxID=543379 RepID=A0A232EDS3_9HYME|nr:hypothetical protein TSAR_012730 [Trichomalopsis sarcophagae]
MTSKSNLITSQNSKVPIAKDAKAISSPATVKGAITNVQLTTGAQNITLMEVQMDTTQHQAQTHKSETPVKAIESSKPVEIKIPTVLKKVVKKEHQKSDPRVFKALPGPALFSTADLIRCVGSTESRTPDSLVTTTLTTPSAVVNNANMSFSGVSASGCTVATESLNTTYERSYYIACANGYKHFCNRFYK